MKEADKNLIITLWNSGTPICRIARSLPYKEGIAKVLIKELRDNGTLIPRDYYHRKKGKKTFKIMAELQNGRRQFEIAEEYGVSRQYVSFLKKRMEEKYESFANDR